MNDKTRDEKPSIKSDVLTIKKTQTKNKSKEKKKEWPGEIKYRKGLWKIFKPTKKK